MIGLQRPCDHADGRRLSGAVGSEQNGDRTLRHLDRQVVQRPDITEGPEDVVDVDDEGGLGSGAEIPPRMYRRMSPLL